VSLMTSKAILLALAPMVYQETFWSNVGFRQADDCPYFNSCFDIPYGDNKWNGNLSKTSTLDQQSPISEGYGFTTQTQNSQNTTTALLDLLTKRTESSTIQTGNTLDGAQKTLNTTLNSHRLHRPSEVTYPEPIPLPLSVTMLLWGLFILGGIKMFKYMDDLENIR